MLVSFSSWQVSEVNLQRGYILFVISEVSAEDVLAQLVLGLMDKTVLHGSNA